MVLTFQHGNKILNALGTNDEPYFLVSEVCDFIGTKNKRELLRRLPVNYKKSISEITTSKGCVLRPHTLEVSDYINNLQPNSIIISEPGLYFAMMTSRQSKQCEEFRDWVVGTVLPSIRKTGSYSILKEELKEVREKASEVNSARVSMTQLNEDKTDLCEKTFTVGQCIDELYPKRYKKGFKQSMGRLVKKNVEPLNQISVDEFQKSHILIKIKTYLYSVEFKDKVAEMIITEIQLHPENWLI
jgi:prophage antirepressor-like protein